MVENTVSKIMVSDEKLNWIEGLVSMESSFLQDEKTIRKPINKNKMKLKIRDIM